MSEQILNRISDKKLAKITTQEIDEASRILPEAIADIESTTNEEERISYLNSRFGFLENSLLHLAAKFADATSVEKIIGIAAGNSEIINSTNKDLFTPLHFAAHSGDPMVAQLLIDAGAKTNPQSSASNRFWTPIHYAAQFGHAAVVKALIDSGVDKEEKTGFDLTPLIIAVEFNQISVLQLMLEIGADKDAQTIAENHSMNALHYAAVGNFCDVAEILLAAGVDREQETISDFDALDLAVQSDNTEMVSLLLKWGVGDIDSAFKLATQLKSVNSLDRIKGYVEAKKNLFNPIWLKKFAPELISELKKCSRANLNEIEISPSLMTPLNIYGILALNRETGLFSKNEESLVQFCIKNKIMDVASIIRTVEQMIP